MNVVFSIAAYLLTRRQGASTRPLTVSNVLLVATIMAAVAVGSTEWFYSLRQEEEYAQAFRSADSVVQAFIQDKLKCCGYFNATVEGIFTSATGFCASDSIAQVNRVPLHQNMQSLTYPTE